MILLEVSIDQFGLLGPLQLVLQPQNYIIQTTLADKAAKSVFHMDRVIQPAN